MTIKTIKRTVIREVKHVRQIADEPFRKWYASRTFDLIVWFTGKNRKDMLGFQLCYKCSGGGEKALTWRKGHGFSHSNVDDGESGCASKMTPLLEPDGAFDKAHVLGRFKASSSGVEAPLREEILRILDGYPA